MKKGFMATIFLSLTIFTTTGCAGNKSEVSDKHVTLTVGTYNIDAKVAGDHNKQRELMEKNNVDIFGIQEVNYKNKRFLDKGIDSYNPIPYFVKKTYKDSYYGNAIDFAGGGYGIATISKSKIMEKSTTKLVTTATAKKYIDEFARIYKAYDPTKPDTVNLMNGMSEKGGISTKGAMEPRVYTRTVIKKDGKKIAFYNTHLNFENKEIRQEQMKQLQTAMKNDPLKYTIAVGDFNADQSTKEFDVWRKDFYMANGGEGIWYDTYILNDDTMKVNSIDNIIVSKNMKIKSVKVEHKKLSDHIPMIAKIELK